MIDRLGYHEARHEGLVVITRIILQYIFYVLGVIMGVIIHHSGYQEERLPSSYEHSNTPKLSPAHYHSNIYICIYIYRTV